MLELATPEDREAVERILKQGHALHVLWRPDIFRMAEELYPEKDFLADIQARQLYVAKISGVVLGYVRVRVLKREEASMVPCTTLLLEHIFVEESCRNQGIGSQMMVEVHSLAKAFGCDTMQLGVYPENEAALALYRKFGFTIRNINMQRNV